MTAILLCASTFIYSNIAFVISLILGRVDFIDSCWGPGFGLIATICYFSKTFSKTEQPFRSSLVLLLVWCWAIRLTAHLSTRLFRKGEDARYQAIRQSSQISFVLKSYFQVYLLQAVLMLVLASPVIVTLLSDNHSARFTFFDVLGMLFWLVGFLIESASDHQLLQFQAKNQLKSKEERRVCNVGMWRYSRHPNHFGEILLWFGIYLIAVNVEHGWMTIYAPILLLAILSVTGVAMVEEGMNSRPGFKEYKEATSVFVPWCPKPQSED